MAADEEVTLSFEAREDITSALRRIEQRLESLDRQFAESAATAKTSGHEIAEGMEEAEEAAKRLSDAEQELAGDLDATSRSFTTQRKHTERTTRSKDRLSDSTAKASKRLGGLNMIFKLFKWPVMIQGGYALASALVAVGGAAVIAVGNLAPMAGIIGPLAGLFLTGKVAMWAWKLAAESLKPQLDGITNQFKALGPQIAAGGLAAGLDNLSTKMSQFVGVTGQGMTKMGATIGSAANRLGDFLAEQDTLDRTSRIFDAMDRVLGHLLNAGLTMLPGVLRLIEAIMPATEKLAQAIERGSTNLNRWLVGWTDSGRAQQFFIDAVDKTLNVLGALWNFLVGIVNIFRIAGSTTGDLSANLLEISERFRAWTESAGGQNSIRKFFEDVQPIMRELWLLIKDLVAGLAGIGMSPETAALIRQLRTQLLPPLLEIIRNLTGSGGLVSALIELASAFLRVLAQIDPAGLIIIANALADVANALAWCAENIPGFGLLLTILVTVVGVLGPVLMIASKVLAVFRWLAPAFSAAGAATKQLTAGQTVLRTVLGWVRTGLTWVWGGLQKVWRLIGPWITRLISWFRSFGGIGGLVRAAVSTALRYLGMLFASFLAMTPVGWVILIVAAIVGVLVWMYFKFDWFRKFVDDTWAEITREAGVAWQWIKDSAIAIWDGIVAAWEWAKNAFQNVVRFIVWLALQIWEIGIKPVVDIILAVWGFTWGVIKWVAQLAIYAIAAVLWVILWVAEKVWQGIAAAATWLWGWLVWIWDMIVLAASTAWNWLYANVIRPVVDWIVARWNAFIAFWTWLSALVISIATAAWGWLYETVIRPVVDWVTARWNAFVAFWTWLNGIIIGAATTVWNWLYHGVIAPVAQWITDRWNAVVGFFTWLWGAITAPAIAAWTSVRDFIAGVAGGVRAAWDAVVGAVKGAYNAVADMWNSLPSINVVGFEFAPPKLPRWLEGGFTGGKFGLVGEAGPEPVMRGGSMIGMAGMNGPELAQMPRGSYVVPTPDVLASTPGLAKGLPASVAGAISRSMPAYADVLGAGGSSSDVTVATPPPAARDDGNAALAGAVRGLARVLDERPPPIAVSGGTSAEENRRMLRRELERFEAERAARRRWDY